MNTGEKIAQVMRRLMAGEIICHANSCEYKLTNEGIRFHSNGAWVRSILTVQELAHFAIEENPKPDQVSVTHVRKVEL